MNKIIIGLIGLAVATGGTCNAENYFKTLLGKSDDETREKMESVWHHFFTPDDIDRYEEDGQTSVYYLDGDKGFILDTGSNDVRTEGMSYGMMISVQLDKPDVFDRLWHWSKEHMAYGPETAWDGYFCWQCAPDGTKIGGSNASDGELYYITSLLLAGEKWNRPDYTAEANSILDRIMSKDGDKTGVYNIFDDVTQLITFVPDSVGNGFTDPSYMLPAFLDYWGEKAESRNDYWKEAAQAARQHLIVSAHPETGLYPDYSNYDGTAYAWPQAGYDTSIYMYDAIRCAMNIGMDAYLSGKDTRRQSEVIVKLLRTFKNDGFRHARFQLDGSKPFEDYTCGMAGSNAVGAIALAYSSNPEDRALAKEYMERLWNTEPPTGKYRYYDGMVYFLAMLHASGNFTL